MGSHVEHTKIDLQASAEELCSQYSRASYHKEQDFLSATTDRVSLINNNSTLTGHKRSGKRVNSRELRSAHALTHTSGSTIGNVRNLKSGELHKKNQLPGKLVFLNWWLDTLGHTKPLRSAWENEESIMLQSNLDSCSNSPTCAGGHCLSSKDTGYCMYFSNHDLNARKSPADASGPRHFLVKTHKWRKTNSESLRTRLKSRSNASVYQGLPDKKTVTKNDKRKKKKYSMSSQEHTSYNKNEDNRSLPTTLSCSSHVCDQNASSNVVVTKIPTPTLFSSSRLDNQIIAKKGTVQSLENISNDLVEANLQSDRIDSIEADTFVCHNDRVSCNWQLAPCQPKCKKYCPYSNVDNVSQPTQWVANGHKTSAVMFCKDHQYIHTSQDVDTFTDDSDCEDKATDREYMLMMLQSKEADRASAITKNVLPAIRPFCENRTDTPSILPYPVYISPVEQQHLSINGINSNLTDRDILVKKCISTDKKTKSCQLEKSERYNHSQVKGQEAQDENENVKVNVSYFTKLAEKRFRSRQSLHDMTSHNSQLTSSKEANIADNLFSKAEESPKIPDFNGCSVESKTNNEHIDYCQYTFSEYSNKLNNIQEPDALDYSSLVKDDVSKNHPPGITCSSGNDLTKSKPEHLEVADHSSDQIQIETLAEDGSLPAKVFEIYDKNQYDSIEDAHNMSNEDSETFTTGCIKYLFESGFQKHLSASREETELNNSRKNDKLQSSRCMVCECLTEIPHNSPFGTQCSSRSDVFIYNHIDMDEVGYFDKGQAEDNKDYNNFIMCNHNLNNGKSTAGDIGNNEQPEMESGEGSCIVTNTQPRRLCKCEHYNAKRLSHDISQVHDPKQASSPTFASSWSNTSLPPSIFCSGHHSTQLTLQARYAISATSMKEERQKEIVETARLLILMLDKHPVSDLCLDESICPENMEKLIFKQYKTTGAECQESNNEHISFSLPVPLVETNNCYHNMKFYIKLKNDGKQCPQERGSVDNATHVPQKPPDKESENSKINDTESCTLSVDKLSEDNVLDGAKKNTNNEIPVMNKTTGSEYQELHHQTSICEPQEVCNEITSVCSSESMQFMFESSDTINKAQTEATHLQSEVSKADHQQTESTRLQSEISKADYQQMESTHLQSEISKADYQQMESTHLQSEISKADHQQTESTHLQSKINKADYQQMGSTHLQSEISKAYHQRTESTHLQSEISKDHQQTESKHLQSEISKAYHQPTESTHLKSEISKAYHQSTESKHLQSEVPVSKAHHQRTESTHLKSDISKDHQRNESTRLKSEKSNVDHQSSYYFERDMSDVKNVPNIYDDIEAMIDTESHSDSDSRRRGQHVEINISKSNIDKKTFCFPHGLEIDDFPFSSYAYKKPGISSQKSTEEMNYQDQIILISPPSKKMPVYPKPRKHALGSIPDNDVFVSKTETISELSTNIKRQQLQSSKQSSTKTSLKYNDRVREIYTKDISLSSMNQNLANSQVVLHKHSKDTSNSRAQIKMLPPLQHTASENVISNSESDQNKKMPKSKKLKEENIEIRDIGDRKQDVNPLKNSKVLSKTRGRLKSTSPEHPRKMHRKMNSTNQRLLLTPLRQRFDRIKHKIDDTASKTNPSPKSRAHAALQMAKRKFPTDKRDMDENIRLNCKFSTIKSSDEDRYLSHIKNDKVAGNSVNISSDMQNSSQPKQNTVKKNVTYEMDGPKSRGIRSTMTECSGGGRVQYGHKTNGDLIDANIFLESKDISNYIQSSFGKITNTNPLDVQKLQAQESVNSEISKLLQEQKLHSSETMGVFIDKTGRLEIESSKQLSKSKINANATESTCASSLKFLMLLLSDELEPDKV